MKGENQDKNYQTVLKPFFILNYGNKKAEETYLRLETNYEKTLYYLLNAKTFNFVG